MTFDEAINFLQQRTPLRITLSGDIGSGKSTFSKRLVEELGIERVSAGELMREEAKRRGITLDELNEIYEQDDKSDRRLDKMQQEKAREVERGVFEGRLAWHFVENPDARVFLAADPEVAAERVWGDMNNPQRDKYESQESLRKANIERKKSETKRYKEYYDLDAYDRANFDVAVDTSKLSIDEVYKQTIIKIAELIKELDEK
ncbi:MAG: (d)CMP kinase [bacterium]